MANKGLGGRPASVEERLATPLKPHKPKVLTSQEWKFVEEFVAGDGHVTLKEAAIRAGYSVAYSEQKARDFTDPDKNPSIVAAIQERRRELGEKYATTFERHMRDLQVIRDQALAAGAYGAAVQAEYRRGQALGTIYIDRKEIRVGLIDSMSKEEVQRKLDEIKTLYGGASGAIVDVTPKQIEDEIEEGEQNVTDTGSGTISKDPREYPKLPFHPNRK